MTLATMFERRDFAPYALQGGEDGVKFEVTPRKQGVDEDKPLPGKANIRIHSDDLVIMHCCCCGGYGTPDDEH